MGRGDHTIGGGGLSTRRHGTIYASMHLCLHVRYYPGLPPPPHSPQWLVCHEDLISTKGLGPSSRPPSSLPGRCSDCFKSQTALWCGPHCSPIPSGPYMVKETCHVFFHVALCLRILQFFMLGVTEHGHGISKLRGANPWLKRRIATVTCPKQRQLQG